MSRHAAAAMCFLGGFVVCGNLSKLVPINPDYDASFFTVAIAVGMSVLAALWEAK